MSPSGEGALRIAVVAPIIVRRDAISLSARDTIRAFKEDSRFIVGHYGCTCELPGITYHHCGDAGELLLNASYQETDVAIFEFGIHHSLFDALLAGGPPVRIVRFHNVTPARFVSPAKVPIIERSIRQIELLRFADEIWADSNTNAQELLARGFDPARLRVIPLAVEEPEEAKLVDKQVERVRILYIGRIAPSKGLHDLIRAAAKLEVPRGKLEITIAGNTAWSDPAYLARLHELIARYDLAEVVHFVGTIDDCERQRLFHTAHILVMPSYHEGFCRPVVEGLRAGCVPIVYDAYNLPCITTGLGLVVPTGNVDALAIAIERLVKALGPALRYPTEPLLPLGRGQTSVNVFTELALRYSASFSFHSVKKDMQESLLRLVRGGARRVWNRTSLTNSNE